MLLILVPKFNRGTKRKQTCQPAPSSIKQSKRVDKTWVKDVILIPSPHFSSVPKFNVREGLYEDKFVLSGFILHSLATEKEFRNTLETAFMDKFAFTPVENKFEFVRAVEKKIVKIRSTDEITGEVLKHFCGSRGPIYIRSTTDLTALLTNRNLLKQDPNSYYPTLDELDKFYGEPMEEATTITTTQFFKHGICCASVLDDSF